MAQLVHRSIRTGTLVSRTPKPLLTPLYQADVIFYIIPGWKAYHTPPSPSTHWLKDSSWRETKEVFLWFDPSDSPKGAKPISWSSVWATFCSSQDHHCASGQLFCACHDWWQQFKAPDKEWVWRCSGCGFWPQWVSVASAVSGCRCWGGLREGSGLVTSSSTSGPLTAGQPRFYQHSSECCSQLDPCSALTLYSFFKQQHFQRTCSKSALPPSPWTPTLFDVLPPNSQTWRTQCTCSAEPNEAT